MKRLAMATAVLTALAAGAQAGSLPKAIRLVNRMKMFDSTHYVSGRGPGGGPGWSSASTEAEARQSPPAQAKPANQKPSQQPQRAD